jgi:predicted Zn-dependent protease with MMP-like domain
MRASSLEMIAQRVVRVTLFGLPATIRQAAKGCRIELAWLAACRQREPELADDLLGLFEGASLADSPADSAESLPRIRLFLDSLWAYVQGDRALFRQEVRVTLLHELGHFLGFDEEQVADLGLE